MRRSSIGIGSARAAACCRGRILYGQVEQKPDETERFFRRGAWQPADFHDFLSTNISANICFCWAKGRGKKERVSAFLGDGLEMIDNEQLKKQLAETLILAYPLPDAEFILDTDASNFALETVPSQVQDGTERVIAYFFKTLGKNEGNYCATKKELLAIVKSVEHLHRYLYGRKFLIRTNHAALGWLLPFKNPEGQIARWIER